jgi:hypothetical protein
MASAVPSWKAGDTPLGRTTLRAVGIRDDEPTSLRC